MYAVQHWSNIWFAKHLQLKASSGFVKTNITFMIYNNDVILHLYNIVVLSKLKPFSERYRTCII